MISAGTAFAVSDDIALGDVNDNGDVDSVTEVNLDDANNVESNVNYDLISEDDADEDVETRIHALDNMTFSTPKVVEGTAYYPLFLTTDDFIPIPLENKSVYIKFNGFGKYYTTNRLGMINYVVPYAPAGDYIIEMIFKGDDGFAESSLTTSIEIYDVETHIVALDEVSYARPLVKGGLAYYPIYLTVDGNLSTPLANKTVYVEFEGDGDFYTTNSLGLINYTLPDFSVGNYTIYMEYLGDEGYIGSNFTTSVEIFNLETRIYALEQLVYSYTEVINHDAICPMFLGTDVIPIPLANKTVIVEFNGVGGEFTTNDWGIIKYSLFKSPVGNYTIYMEFNGDDGYLPSNFTSTVEIVKGETEICADDVTVDYADPEGKLVATLIDDYGQPLAHANVYVNLNDVDYALKTNSKGQIEVSTADLLPGNYVALISYKGSTKKYTPSSTYVDIFVDKQDTFISAVYDNKTKELVATLTNAYNKTLAHANVYVTLDDVDYTLKTNSKGQVILSAADLAPDSYIAHISYRGNGVYKSAEVYFEFITFNTFLVTQDVHVVYGEGKLVATLYDIDGKGIKGAYLTVNINGENQKLKTDSNGKIELSTANLLPGSYVATISYKGNDKGYTPATATAEVTVSKLDSMLTAVYDSESGELVANLTDENGKAIKGAYLTVNINGENQKVRTDSKGQAKLPVEGLEKGSYIATISYKGSNAYKAVSTKTKVVIR